MNLGVQLAALATTFSGFTSTAIGGDEEEILFFGTSSCSLIATTMTGNARTQDQQITDAKNYMDSLSEEQLIALEEKLNLKDMEISMEKDVPKVRVYAMGNKNDKF